MPTRTSSASYKLGALVLLYRHKFFSRNMSRGPSSSSKFEHTSSMHQGQGLKLMNANSRIYEKPETEMLINDDKYKAQPAKVTVPSSPKPSLSIWVKCFLGSILSLLLPFWKQKWETLFVLGGTVEKVVEEVETVAEVIEKVATTTEKLSAEVADKLPNDTRLKEAALMVEHISTITAKDAQLTSDLIHKVDNLEQDLKDIKAIIEPVIDKIVEMD